jgi:hypothetical protein
MATVLRRNGETTLGFAPLLSTFKSNVQTVMDVTAAYKGNTAWYTAYGLSPSLLEKVIEKYAYYSNNGNTIAKNAGNIVADIKKETGVLLNTQQIANAIGTMDLALISYAKKYPDSGVVKWWRTGKGSISSAASATGKAVESAAKTVFQKTQSTLATIKDGAGDLVDSALPWYLKPKTLIFSAAGLGAVYLLLPQIVRSVIGGVKEARKP